MNKKIGIIGSAINIASVVGFAIAMLFGSLFMSYFTSIMIAFSFVMMAGAFAAFCPVERKAAAFAGLGFAAMYALCNAVVYFIQISTVLGGMLDASAASYLDFQKFGLIFNLDMLGYCLMAMATVFLGLTIEAKSKADLWLKWLLLIHGIFSISCFVIPLLGLFSADMGGADWIGTLVLEFWCLYFIPIGVLSAVHFKKL